MVPVFAPLPIAPGLGAAIGYALGMALCVALVLLFWVVRPLLLPRKGIWKENNYVVNGVIEGHIIHWGSDESYSASSDPPLWVGIGGYKQFDNEMMAREQIERDCR